MGNQQSDNSEGYIEDSRFGLIKIEGSLRQTQSEELDSSQSDEVILLKNHQMSSSQFQQWKLKLASYKQCKQFLFLPLHTKQTQKSYCGGNCTLELRYPVYRILLREQIINRYKIDKPYDEAEMWYLLYNLVTLGKKFQKLGHKIGDIHPKNIIINEKGLMKVIGSVSLPKQQDNFTKICDSQINDVFLAPEQIDYECFERYRYPPGVNPNTAELFSIGMTILQAGTLELSTYVYDKGPYRINFKKLRSNLEIFQAKYDKILYQIVESLVAHKPSSRKTCKNIVNILKPFQSEILNLEPFNFENYKNEGKGNKGGDSLVYSGGNSQINHNSTVIPSHLIETKGMHSNIFLEEKHLPNTIHNTYQGGNYQGKVQNPIQISKIKSETNLKRYDPSFQQK